MNLTLGSASYNETNKKRFEREARKLLRDVVRLLELPKGSYDLRHNKAGIACSGDYTLHTDQVYVQINLDSLPAVLVRTCKSRKDYTGGRNQWYSFDDLRKHKAPGLASFIKQVIG